jgi:hypothetical protein
MMAGETTCKTASANTFSTSDHGIMDDHRTIGPFRAGFTLYMAHIIEIYSVKPVQRFSAVVI